MLEFKEVGDNFVDVIRSENGGVGNGDNVICIENYRNDDQPVACGHWREMHD